MQFPIVLLLDEGVLGTGESQKSSAPTQQGEGRWDSPLGALDTVSRSRKQATLHDMGWRHL